MVFLFSSLLLGTLFLSFIPIFFLYIRVFPAFSYWKRKKVPYLKPTFPLGNFTKSTLSLKTNHDLHAEFYRKIKYEMKLPYAGLYKVDKPLLLVTHPEMIKHILIKDFDYFMDRGVIDVHPDKDPVLDHLFNKKGLGWKRLRNKLSPAFTSGKLKQMFTLIEQCSENFVEEMNKSLGDAKERELDLKDFCMRYTTDVIASTAFGVEANTLKNVNSEFYSISNISKADVYRRIVKGIFITLFPWVRKIISVPLADKRLITFFTELVRANLHERENNNIRRADFIDILLQMRNEDRDKEISKDDVRVTDMVITAQSFNFYNAAFETSSLALSFCLMELALQQDIQRSLRQEVQDMKRDMDGKLDYEALHRMSLLDKVFKETLRKYPSLPQLNRKVVQPYQLPGTNITLDKGTQILIPIYAIHHDPEFYPDPEKFDPERFSPENVQSRPRLTYLAFGDGPRNCIGMRFGLIQFKKALAELISNFEFDVDPGKTRQDFTTGSFLLNTASPLILKVKRIV